MSLQRTQLIASSVLLAALLTACGGGGGEDAQATTTASSTSTSSTAGETVTAEASAKYLGTWVNCSADGGNSEREVVRIERVSATVITFAFELKSHAGTGCTGTGTAVESGSATVTIGANAVTIGGQPADKLDVVVDAYTGADAIPAGTKAKWVGTASSTAMRIGFDGTFDAAGYPTAFQDTYTKQ